ncbi:hypothetical_protein [Candidozyma auris]|uniref:hypothetical_protein n=1 Tax=Candidozyma auris TaxID=498019 RepID=UPI001258A1F3|nr:hypothetical_protein [[Candida] auris]QEO22906.1 hypothetical_protein [[Candida] auris]
MWVESQHRAMARWVSCKVEQKVDDLTRDLQDGLVLVKLVNVIIDETGSVSYSLEPIHKNPTLHLHKVENIDDVLKFCRLILKINTCSICGENVVEGNLKLILGLIWTLFVYATSTSISVANESNSIHEIKRILLQWINKIRRSKALDETSNFSKDWSLQAGSRPDLAFAAICDYYLPGVLFDYQTFKKGKPLANLDIVLRDADSKLHIPQLMVSNDFNVLVPDEKCMILYLLQWYTFFELTPDVPDSPVVQQEDNKNDGSLTNFMKLVLEASRTKLSFEGKAIRLVDQINSNIMKVSNINEELCSTVVPANLGELLDQFCSDLSGSADVSEQLRSRTQFQQILMFSQFFIDLLTAYEHFTIQIKPTYLHHDFPELQSLLKAIGHTISKTGIPCYQPEKSTSLSTITIRLECLNELDSIVGEKMLEVLDMIRNSKLAQTDRLIAKLEAHLKANSRRPVPESLKKYVDELSQIMEIKQQLDRFHAILEPKHNTHNLRVLLDSLETIDVPETPQTPTTEETMAFSRFQKVVSEQHNQQNLSHADLQRFLQQVTGGELSKNETRELISLVPSRRMLNRSESDEFSMYNSDENTSIDESVLFDKVQETMEQKLAGTYNKLYNLAEFVERLEKGFSV